MDEVDGRPLGKVQKGKRRKSMAAALRNLFKKHVTGSSTAGSDEEENSISSIPPFQRGQSQDLSFPARSKLRPDEAWMQGVHNALALVCALIIGSILLAVYFVLEPFFHPLVWATLIGMVIHPFKHACTSKITDSLKLAQEKQVPLSFIILLAPFSLVSWLARNLDEFFWSHFATVMYIAVGEVLVLLVYLLDVPNYIYEMDFQQWHVVLSYYQSLGSPFVIMVVSLLVGIVSVSFMCVSELAVFFSSVLWLIILVLVSHKLFGPVAVSAVLVVYAVAVVFYFTRTKKSAGKSKSCNSSHLDLSSEKSAVTSDRSVSEISNTKFTSTTLGKEHYEVVPAVTVTSGKEGTGKESGDGSSSITDESHDKTKRSVSFGAGTAQYSNASLLSMASSSTLGSEARIDSSSSFGQNFMDGSSQDLVDGGGSMARKSRQRSHQKSLESAHRARQNTNFVFVVLIVSAFFVCVWKYTLFRILIAFILFLLLGRFIYPYFRLYIVHAWTKVSTVNISITGVIFPPPVAVIGRAVYRLDQFVLSVAIQWVGDIVTMCIVVGLLVTLFVASIMLLLQVQVELSHYLAEGVVLWNRTVEANPDLDQWIDGMGIQSNSMETAVHYVRGFIENRLHSVLDGADNSSLVVQQVMGVFDNLHNTYFIHDSSSEHGPLFSQVNESPFFSLRQLFSDNLGTIFSLLQSVGAILSANVSVAMSMFYALLHVVFSGGTVLLNMIVFVTALFYLLSLSDEVYLPVQWFTDLIPQLSQEGRGGNNKEEPFQRAIKSVFYTSFRRAGFYGVYIWLTHTVMGASASILPSALGAMAAAVPLVKPYWVFVLAVLELWLIKGEIFLAVTMVLLMLLPEFYIYSLINEEIEGAHPYLTGLAIAGGIYFAGLEGALVGPMLLCCLLCFVDIYEDIFNN